MTFQKWLNKIEAYSTRQERLDEDVDFKGVASGDIPDWYARQRMYVWLEAAYNVGYADGRGDTHD